MSNAEWVANPRFVRAVRAPVAAPAEPGGPPPVLHRLACALRADHVSLLHLDHAADRLRVVAVGGVPFIASGMELSLQACPLIAPALAGRVEAVCVEEAEGPLGVLAQASGMRAAVTAPLGRFGAAASGAVLIASAGVWLDGGEALGAIAAERAALERLQRLSAPPAARVLVGHEDALTADGIARQVEQRLRVTAVACTSLPEMLEAVALQPPDLIACSERLSVDELADVAAQVRAAGAAAPLLALARTETAHSIAAALRAGIAGYVALDGGPEPIVDAAAAVLDGRSVLPALPPDDDRAALTTRELQVLRGFDRGLSSVAIARELHVAPSTVKSHSRHLFRKLGVGSRTAALHEARQRGLL